MSPGDTLAGRPHGRLRRARTTRPAPSRSPARVAAAVHISDHYRFAREARRSRAADRRGATVFSTRTSTSTVRAPRARGVGFYGKNTLLITRGYGSWSCSGRSSRRRDRGERSARARLRLVVASASTRARPMRSRRPGSSTRPAASPTGRRRPSRFPRSTERRSGARCTAATSARTSAPGTAASRSAALVSPGPGCRAGRLAPRVAERARRRPSHALPPLVLPTQRCALPAPQRARRGRQLRRPDSLDAVAPFADGEDPLLRDHAQWAADRLSGRG